MKQHEVENNIDHYRPSQDEIVLAEDTLNLINLVCNCNAKWKDLREMYARLPYGCVAMAIWEEDGTEYYTHAWTEIIGSEVKVSVGVNILEVATRQVFKYDKPFEHGQLVDEIVNFESLESQKDMMEEDDELVYFVELPDEPEDDGFDAMFDSVFNLNSDNSVEIQDGNQEDFEDSTFNRYMQYQKDLQYAKSFKEQFGTDSIEMNEEVANTKLFFGAITDFLGL